ncbi:VWA domain-containing protein [Saccharibacillus alkalitolerans]|uniref:VWA domain-containing protein n=1 Tax=Saccharibacillus alkalitolerans TaxID=2705290 RepID=A0ABX0F4F0_9BACL|nr:VWA domain-containing protein [Saccharibacillus alkalitolerans]NGZ74874.1 VWA domain-containing protein [Saccharibacillus alkalitolerans]
MSIDLRKKAEENLISLSKTATISLGKKGLGNQRARVALALDISGSMTGLFSSGIVQAVCERTLGLGMNFDDNGAADVFLFGVGDYSVGEIGKENFYEFVDREIRPKYKLENGTNYAGVMQRIADYYYPGALSVKKGLFGLGRAKVSVSAPRPEEPVYVIFVTDGNCFDGERAAEIVRRTSRLGIFWQFVGVGKENFQFLKKLDDLDGRLIDNANFFQVNDLKKISDEELYDRLLGEFPDWLKAAKENSLIK